MVRIEPEVTRPVDLADAAEGLGGALVARVVRRGTVSFGGSGLVSLEWALFREAG